MANKKLSDGFKELSDEVVDLIRDSAAASLGDWDDIDPNQVKLFATMMRLTQRSLNLSAQLIEMYEATNDKFNLALDKYLND